MSPKGQDAVVRWLRAAFLTEFQGLYIFQMGAMREPGAQGLGKKMCENWGVAEWDTANSINICACKDLKIWVFTSPAVRAKVVAIKLSG